MLFRQISEVFFCWPKITTFLKIKLLVSNFFCQTKCQNSDKLSNRSLVGFRQLIALPALHWSFGFCFRGLLNSKIWLHTTRTAPSRMYLRLSSQGVHDPCGSARNKLLRSSYARSKCHFVATSFSLVHTRSFLTPPANPMEFDFKFGDRQIKFIIKRGALSPTGACRLPWSYEIGF